jgi:hypothetical protein
LKIVLLTLGMSLSGCTTFMSWLVGLPPVTEDRCKAFNMFQIGLADGETAQRPGERFDFWDKDCRQVGVHLNRPEYDRGYEQGLRNYCSCERGFEAGAKEEYLELKGQYAICRRAEYKLYEAGHKAAAGLKIPKDEIKTEAAKRCAAPFP